MVAEIKQNLESDLGATVEVFTSDSRSQFDRLMERLTPGQQKAATMLISGTSQTETAKRCQIGTTTLKRWLFQPQFKQVLTAGSRLIYEAELLKLNVGFGVGLDTLIDLARSAEAEAVRKQAAAELVDVTLKIQGLAELNQRVETLEALLSER